VAHRIVDEIIADNEWRDTEFAQFKINTNKVDTNLWSRMCVPMIYAHWEGFIVNALRTLMRHLNTLELAPEKYTTNLVVIGLGSAYQSLSGKQSFEQKVIFTQKFNEHLRKPIKFELKIDTKSNLNFSVLKELCQKFGFQHGTFKSIERDINDLVHIRNSIAHGENAIIPDAQKLENLIKTARGGMDLFLQEIDLFLTNEVYLLK
jgi:hypothetical protein